ncbi:hypothetical protein ABMA28_010503 [Loxostege sticticalis]|uniref:Prostamide/prostaglandin F synthase n=1 Tax=Loxostege sticticalis TaxID=481309 RepID=A0ABD0SAM0_LOXSC
MQLALRKSRASRTERLKNWEASGRIRMLLSSSSVVGAALLAGFGLQRYLSEIAPVLAKHNIKLVGIGVEKYNSEEFVQRKFFAGDLYYVENVATYRDLGFNRFNHISIVISLLWKKTRESISIGRSLGLGGDIRGDWVQTGGALLIQKGGKVLHHFTQTGPGEHMSNYDILKTFGLEHEYKPEMANKKLEDREVCNRPSKKA